MIDTTIPKNAIFIDHSILSTFSSCEEKGRLAYVEHLSPVTGAPPLIFGSAFHDALAAYYTSVSKKEDEETGRLKARAAFLSTVRTSPGTLPISADSEEKRSVERGLYLVEAYITRWRQNDLMWEDVINPTNGKPYVEMGFATYFMDWKGCPVLYVGKVDRIRRYRVDDQLYNWESKTTGSGVKRYIEQVRPNHQITGYVWSVQEATGLRVAGTLLDVIYVSDRKVDGKFPNGIDIERDFARVETRRSRVDVEEFLQDLKMKTVQFLTFRDSAMPRWHRNAPGACFMYGGCHFRDICNSNLNATIIRTRYKKEVWAPWSDLLKEPTKSEVATSPSSLEA